jgi:chromosome condensin MukBEF MukE localization factor
MNSFSRKKVLNRRSTHSDISRERLSEHDASSDNRRRSKSLTTADRGERWTDAEVDKAIESGRHLSVDPVRRDADHTHEEEDSKAKTKKWRRLSSMFGRKKH